MSYKQVMSRSKKPSHRDGLITLERLERALALVSWMILEDGPAMAPYLERLEREIEQVRRQNDVVARARRYLTKYGSKYLAVTAKPNSPS